MVVRSDDSINKYIIEMRKNRCKISTIFEWLLKWDNFSNLDEIIVLTHIKNILNDHNFAVSKNEIQRVFNKFYNKDFHGDKKSYLAWIYQNSNLTPSKNPSFYCVGAGKYPQTSTKNILLTNSITFSQNQTGGLKNARRN